MGVVKKIRCHNCKRLFVPDCRNRNRQRYCKNPECRKKAKTASQQKWLQKPENKNYFKGPLNTRRVQEWRKQHPGYFRKKRLNKQAALQDRLNAQASEINKDNSNFTNNALQDSLIIQPAVIIGLISQFTGSALQDDIAKTLIRMQQLGQDVLSCQFNGKRGGSYDCKACDFTEPVAQSP
jgi:hypothetical protein